MLEYFLAFLSLTAGVAFAWAMRRKRQADEQPTTLATTKRFFGGWIVLVVAGIVAFAIFVIVTFVGFANLVGSLPKQLDGCFNC